MTISNEDLKTIHDAFYQEWTYWKKWFLIKNHVSDSLAQEFFLSLPNETFLKKSPEENLIDCLSASLTIKKEKE